MTATVGSPQRVRLTSRQSRTRTSSVSSATRSRTWWVTGERTAIFWLSCHSPAASSPSAPSAPEEEEEEEEEEDAASPADDASLAAPAAAAAAAPVGRGPRVSTKAIS